MEKIEKRLGAFRLHPLVAIVALILEFLLGMYTALFVVFPENLAGGNAAASASPSGTGWPSRWRAAL
jgi:hypothetical protein